MKNIIISAIIFITGTTAYATTICGADDTIAIILDPEIGGTSGSSNSSTKEFYVAFPYGTLWGISTCAETPGTQNMAIDELRDSNGRLVTGGENSGSHCWCKMTHPAASNWVYFADFATTCHIFCASTCYSAFKSGDSAFRASIFESVGK